MSCQWLRVNQSISKGISTINQIDKGKFEQFLGRIVSNLSAQSTDIFTEQERSKLEKIFRVDEQSVILAIKTVHYILKRMLKYIFKPISIKKDLESVGLDGEKADLFIKVWSSETRSTLDNLTVSKHQDSLSIKWRLNAELSSDVVKKAKVPKAYVKLATNDFDSSAEMELTHDELYAMFLQLEAIQSELDTLM